MTKTHKSKKSDNEVSVKIFIDCSRLSEDSPIMKMARDPKQAETFLKKAGIIIEAGKLAPEYSGEIARNPRNAY